MDSILLMAGQWGSSERGAHRTAERMVELFDRLRELRSDLKFLCPSEGSAVPRLPLRVARAVEAKRHQAVLRFPVRNDRDAYLLRWPKDAIQAFGGVTAIANSRVCRLLATQLGLSNVQVSPWCEGGMTVRAGRDLLVSSNLLSRRRLAPLPTPYLILPMPAPSDAIAGAPTHLDLDCAAVFTRSHQALLLFSERYFAANRPAANRVAQELGAEIFVVPRREVVRRVLNLIFLPPAAVLMPADCPATQAFLAQRLGPDKVVTVEIDSSFNYNGGFGGLGCMSSLIAAHF